jgi:phosphoribosylamine---glycine ligase
MKILLVGSGGREHALALRLCSSRTPVELHTAPGSDALGELGPRLPLEAGDVAGLRAWCAAERPDLVVIGPEAPLVAGLADALRQEGVPVFGHDAATARLEGSKAFAKDFMVRHGIPCARSLTVSDPEAGERAIRDWTFGYPLVLKADGLAAGKGVVLAEDEAEALATLRAFLGGRFGEASRTVVLEEHLFGMELSLHVLADVDASRIACLVLPPCQDHKRLLEGDRGPNTGGMGAFGPIPCLGPEHLARLRRDLVEPTLRGLQADGLGARGVLFLGVMWTAGGPRLLEYNVRFGDPETQVLLRLLDEDLPSLLLEVAEGRLVPREPRLRLDSAIAVVLAAEGYPGAPRMGVPIRLEDVDADVIHAGTRRVDGQWLTNGGRVLNLVASAPTLEEARSRIRSALGKVGWEGMQARGDIGLRAQRHFEAGRGPCDPW